MPATSKDEGPDRSAVRRTNGTGKKRTGGGIMTAANETPVWDPMVLAGQLQSIAEQSQALMLRFLSKQPDDGHLGMGDPTVLGGAFLELMTKMMSDPAAVASAQINLFNESMTVWRHAAERMLNLPS